ncbi:hypothetical protein HPB47_018018 [Ixodes persulcatus]|uniref:Uncharacterized protein n=1 Tax=Ixodes persulcatus TaxID=34615 RepID=A0AC60QNS7_IXOPE|nr:hypothetical protein HPB47_018018 [Ixodes persulcatus]
MSNPLIFLEQPLEVLVGCLSFCSHHLLNPCSVSLKSARKFARVPAFVIRVIFGAESFVYRKKSLRSLRGIKVAASRALIKSKERKRQLELAEQLQKEQHVTKELGRADAERIARVNQRGERDLQREIALVQQASAGLATHAHIACVALIKRIRGGANGVAGSTQAPQVQKFFVHESFVDEPYASPKIFNDIALLKLVDPFDFGKSEGHIGAVCLPAKDRPLEGKVAVTGWGQTSHAVVKESEPAILVGVVSFGHGCAEAPAYGVYTRVPAFTAWIAENIAKLQS